MTGYRVFKTTYKDRKGRTKEAAKWYVEFRDQLDTVRRLPAFTSKAASEEMGRNLVKLVAYHKGSGGQTDPALTRWLTGLPQRTRDKLVRIGLLDGAARRGRQTARRPSARLAPGAGRPEQQRQARSHQLQPRPRPAGRLPVPVAWPTCRRRASRRGWRRNAGPIGCPSRPAITTSAMRSRSSAGWWMTAAPTAIRCNRLKPLNADVEDHRQRRCLPDDDFQDFLTAAHDGQDARPAAGPGSVHALPGRRLDRPAAQELASLQPGIFPPRRRRAGPSSPGGVQQAQAGRRAAAAGRTLPT